VCGYLLIHSATFDNKVLNFEIHSAYELKDERGKVCGEFNKRQLKQYREEKDKKVEV
jgi:hypothetical protein